MLLAPQELLNFPATLAFADKPLGTSATAGSYVNKLPANVKLVTLTSNYASINEGQLLIRLSHLYPPPPPSPPHPSLSPSHTHPCARTHIGRQTDSHTLTLRVVVHGETRYGALSAD